MLTWWLQSNIEPIRESWFSRKFCDGTAHDDRGMLADLHRVVLGVDAEGIEPHRLEDGVAHEATPAAVDVAAREGDDVPDVQPLGRRVRKHHQVVEGPVGVVELGTVVAALVPDAAPACLDRRVVVHVEPARIRRDRGGERVHDTKGIPSPCPAQTQIAVARPASTLGRSWSQDQSEIEIRDAQGDAESAALCRGGRRVVRRARREQHALAQRCRAARSAPARAHGRRDRRRLHAAARRSVLRRQVGARRRRSPRSPCIPPGVVAAWRGR